MTIDKYEDVYKIANAYCKRWNCYDMLDDITGVAMVAFVESSGDRDSINRAMNNHRKNELSYNKRKSSLNEY